MKRFISIILIITVFTVMGPISSFAVLADSPAKKALYELSNENISVNVWGKNGGFIISTKEGNKFIKSDDNKELLYHNDEYDTSFTSFQVTYPGNETKEYIFGGSYSFLGLGGNNLTTVEDSTGITSTWTVDDLTFIQRIELANPTSNEHGMVIISYKVQNNGNKNVSINQRLLLDSTLGQQDYAIYKIMDKNNVLRTIEKEQVVDANDFIPMAFFGYDNPEVPGIVSYTVNSDTSMPYKVAFGHWNNLASTAFDFVPDPTMHFTSKNNFKYQTADSAYALYYDMGKIPAGGEGKIISTNYGVYSNAKGKEQGEIAINAVSPISLTLSKDKKTYEEASDSLPGEATFQIQAQFDNYTSEKVKDYDKVTVAFYTSKGILPLDSSGKEIFPTPTYDDPFSVDIINIKEGTIRNGNFYFKALVDDNTAYRKIEMKVFDTSNVMAGGGEALLQENLIGSQSFYILCPGGYGSFPKITFTGSKPDILYYKGERHLYVTGKNLDLLLDGSRSGFSLYAYNTSNPNIKYEIEDEYIRKPEPDVLEVIFSEEMTPGSYDLKFELTDDFAQTLGVEKTLTAPALKVIMEGDPKYESFNYGIVAVVQETVNNSPVYSLKSYKTEVEFNNDKSSYKEVLLTFRGSLIKEKDDKGNDRYKAFSGSRGENTISINNCMDFKGGTVSIYHHYSGDNAKSVYVDFDGDLCTSVAGTSIWKGESALTEIKNGQEYGLIPYNKNGEKLVGHNDLPIMVIWPNAVGLHQTISGMIFKLTYGALGIVYDTTGTEKSKLPANPNVLGNTLSFSAVLDLGFIIPKSETNKKSTKNPDIGWTLYWISEDPSGQLRGLWNRYYDDTKKKATQQDKKEFAPGQAKVMVDDILFGCGQGFMGVNFAVEVGLPAYSQAMPAMHGVLRVNTINDWSFGVAGKCQFTTIVLEFDLAIKSYKNIPIPDKLYFYVAGFEPGVNVDGFGVLWITGGGGGFDKLYDTIFMTDGLPPLKLMLSVAFDIMKVLSARADLSLGLRGLGFSVTNVKLKGTDIPILTRLQLQLDWYPDIYLMAALDATFYGIIRGQGYIIFIDNEQYDTFFEAFVRGMLYIPKGIPFIGGIELARVDFGLNNEKIWGAASIIGDIGVGVVYYWGGNVSVSLKKGSAAQPTFPELLGCDDIPVYYDEETGRTLYMSIGSNLMLSAAAEVTKDFATTPVLLGTDPSVKSDANKEKHIIYAPDDGKRYILTAAYAAESEEDAKDKANTFVMRKNGTNEDFSLIYYDGNPDNLSSSNANVTYDEVSKMATLGVTYTKLGDFDVEWELLTPGVSADLILFEAGTIPKVNSVNGTLDNGSIAATWNGNDLDKLDSLSFYLTTEDDDGNSTGEESGELLINLTDSTAIAAKSGTFPIPKDLKSGTYYLRAVYSREDEVNGVIVDKNPINYVNNNQPSDPAEVIIENAGDLAFGVNLGGTLNGDGYLASVYEVDNDELKETDITNMAYEKDEKGELPPVSIGGSYEGIDKDGNTSVYGLTAGKTYKVGVTAYKYVDEDKDGLDDYIMYGNEVLSNEEILNNTTPPEINITSKLPFIPVEKEEWHQDEEGNSVKSTITEDTSPSKDVTFDISSDVPINGIWFLDSIDNEGMNGEFTDVTDFSIELNNLLEGGHTLNISGKDVDGDSYRRTVVFTVDTQPPKLLLSSPKNGSCFKEDGMLKIAGVTDGDAYLTIKVDGDIIRNSRDINTLDENIDADGVFNFDIHVDPGQSSHEIIITVSDEAGNSESVKRDVQNVGLSNINRLNLYSNGSRYSNTNIPLSNTGNTVTLMSLEAETDNGSFFINDSSLVAWGAQVINGSASIDENGNFTAEQGSLGTVSGELKVTDSASMTAFSTFGAEIFSKGYDDIHELTVGTTIGGEAKGSGRYKEGEKVKITAIPKSGYRFSHWTVTGNAIIENKYASVTTITILNEDVYVTANFEYTKDKDSDKEKERRTSTGKGDEDILEKGRLIMAVQGSGGEKINIDIPEGVSKDNIRVYVRSKGVLYPMPWFRQNDLSLTLFPLIDGEYYIVESDEEFNDINEHWALEYIKSAISHGIFNGIGEGRFDPNGKITRAMFVTILGRLHCIETADYGEKIFNDIEDNSWYSPYSDWAYKCGITKGDGYGNFNPQGEISREEMAVMLKRYIEFAGFDFKKEPLGIPFGDIGEAGNWSVDSIEFIMSTGLMNGNANNHFMPKGRTTRAEAATVLIRLIEKVLLSK